MRGILVAAFAASVLGSSPVAAQDKQSEPEIVPGIPASAMPPEGMCRVWLKDVPVNRQPSPTDCASAIRTRPRDAILLLGEAARNAKLPNRTPTTTSARSSGSDIFGRNARGSVSTLDRLEQQQRITARNLVTPRGTGSAATPSPAPAAAVKSPEAKAAIVKPPQH